MTTDERTAQIQAHRACLGVEHNPEAGKMHGMCVVCGVPFPCAYVGPPLAQPAPAVPEEYARWYINALQSLLRRTKRALLSIERIAPGYDWNADPRFLTRLIGDTCTQIDALAGAPAAPLLTCRACDQLTTLEDAQLRKVNTGRCICGGSLYVYPPAQSVPTVETEHDEVIRELAADLDVTPDELVRHAHESVGAPASAEALSGLRKLEEATCALLQSLVNQQAMPDDSWMVDAQNIAHINEDIRKLLTPPGEGQSAIEPTERPSSLGTGRDAWEPNAKLLLNRYGRACWDAGYEAHKREGAPATGKEGAGMTPLEVVRNNMAAALTDMRDRPERPMPVDAMQGWIAEIDRIIGAGEGRAAAGDLNTAIRHLVLSTPHTDEGNGVLRRTLWKMTEPAAAPVAAPKPEDGR